MRPVREQLYIPYLISLEEFCNTLMDQLPNGREIDLSIVLKEMLEQLFHDKVGTYGPYHGCIGAYLMISGFQPVESVVMDLDILLHDFQAILTDTLVSIFPNIGLTPTTYRYFNPPGTHSVLVYEPVIGDVPPALSGKVVPASALHYTLR